MKLKEHAYSNLLDVLRHRCEQTPDKQAFTYLRDGEIVEAGLTYEELYRRSAAVAVELVQQGLAGDTILLLYPPGLDFLVGFYGCIFASCIPVPVVPPRNNRNLSNFDSIHTDAGATAVLSNADMGGRLRKIFSGIQSLDALPIIATDTVSATLADAWRAPSIQPDDMAFLQYTSGSTSAPKGVMVTHANLLHNNAMMQAYFGHTSEERFANWLPHFHDMGLIGNLLQTVFVGGHCDVMAPSAFVKKPIAWLNIMSSRGATYSGSPNFGYQLCVDRVTEAQRDALDLSGWRNAYCGAEPIRPATLQSFMRTYARCGFRPEAMYPCYGMAETTLMISGGSTRLPPVIRHFDKAQIEADTACPVAADAHGAHAMVGCGRPAAGQIVAIVDPETRLEKMRGAVGEIWVSGPSACKGYYQNAEATEETFRQCLPGYRDRTFVRSGDLGFVDQEGELFVSGRLKDLIIVNGRNHYPQDIELVVAQCHPSLTVDGGATFSVDSPTGEKVVVTHEIERSAIRDYDFEEIVRSVRKALSDTFEIELDAFVLLRPGRVAKTSSGKIRRSASRRAYLMDQLEAVDQWKRPSSGEPVAEPAPHGGTDFRCRESVQIWLSERIASYLALSRDDVETTRPVAEYGMNSSVAMQLLGDITEGIEKEVEPTLIWEYPTIDALSEKIVEMRVQ